MKNFLQKVFLQKFLLLTILFLNGCNSTPFVAQHSNTPSETLVNLIGGLSGNIVNNIYYFNTTFVINDDATEYTLSSLNNTLYYMQGGSNWATYEGNTSKGYAIIKLTDITNYTMNFTLEIDGEIIDNTEYTVYYLYR